MDIRTKELEATVDELQSELEVRSTEMQRLRNEKTAVMDKYIQLKRKHYYEDTQYGGSNEVGDMITCIRTYYTISSMSIGIVYYVTKEEFYYSIYFYFNFSQSLHLCCVCMRACVCMHVYVRMRVCVCVFCVLNHTRA